MQSYFCKTSISTEISVSKHSKMKNLFVRDFDQLHANGIEGIIVVLIFFAKNEQKLKAKLN